MKQAPDEARGRDADTGAETAAGSAVAETGARGQGFGLSTGGGLGPGVEARRGRLLLPEYIALMIEQNPRQLEASSRGAPATSIVKFTIQRDGTLTDIAVEKPSGYPSLDLTAQRAMVVDAAAPAAAGRRSRTRR